MRFHGYTFDAVLRHTNSGGVYRAHTADGCEVVIKEARAHNGYAGEQDAKTRLEHEYLALRAVHARVPGLCPEPIEFFTEWEHAYLVTELVPGRTLVKWTVATTPVIHAGESPEVFADYYRRCLAILDRLGTQLGALHELGARDADALGDAAVMRRWQPSPDGRYPTTAGSSSRPGAGPAGRPRSRSSTWSGAGSRDRCGSAACRRPAC